MRIDAFGVEIWMNRHENHCRYNLAETCVESLTVAELLALAGKSNAILDELLPMKLTYGAIEGSQRLRDAIAELYETRGPDDVLVAHGAIGANSLVYSALVEPGDTVISIVPTYQQHVSIPESLGATVKKLPLREEQGYAVDLDELRDLTKSGAKLIAFANPNNPTGALMDRAVLEEIVRIAEGCSAWVLSDEVYRGIDQSGDGTTASVADMYPKGISIGSMSKAFSLAGLRLGWIVGDPDLLRDVSIHRDYNTISVGMVDDLLAAIALESRDAILARNRAIVRQNLAILDEWVAGQPSISWERPQGGTTALLRYGEETDSEAFCLRLLEETGVLFTPGAALGAEGTVRIGYANNTQILREGLGAVSEFLAGR
ncbi:aminotransferase [Mesorhizobium sp. CAU 1741]|uniref:aminotransferase n=1 Tax=Mesorhizobium sp. CAU 1741 TaxID=3140366 RepID=UPI00325B27CD